MISYVSGVHHLLGIWRLHICSCFACIKKLGVRSLWLCVLILLIHETQGEGRPCPWFTKARLLLPPSARRQFSVAHCIGCPPMQYDFASRIVVKNYTPCADGDIDLGLMLVVIIPSSPFEALGVQRPTVPKFCH